MRDTPPGLRYAVPSAVAGGVVYAVVSVVVTGELDFAGGAVFMLVFGFVVTVGLVYADRSDRKRDEAAANEDDDR
ncbi:hypothetical protein [Halogeometricum limi]|uniref:Uncharacterized protein n=1 Tax=Halogeometricum limi TaxID=555875 RepID=A0A1I6H796_9EURY|nr:hypothetical protein [Halogeometricum limi]SFR50353.1 hypothetical protein SAMN04488124_1873 [Halogeometricum limi]